MSKKKKQHYVPSYGKIFTFFCQTYNQWNDCFLHKKVDTPISGADMSLKTRETLTQRKLQFSVTLR